MSVVNVNAPDGFHSFVFHSFVKFQYCLSYHTILYQALSPLLFGMLDTYFEEIVLRTRRSEREEPKEPCHEREFKCSICSLFLFFLSYTEDDAAELEKGNYCFPETASVLLESGQRVRMNELKIGDKVETSNTQNGQIVFSEVLAFLDYKVNLTIDYVVIETDSPPAKLTITESHLLYKLNKQTQQGSISVHARDIKAGDYVYVRGNGTGLTLAQVTATRRIRAKGAYAPLTESGNVLVDNVLSSCYALVQDHTLAHWSFAPFRLLARFYPDFASGGEQTEGMHWYAKLLYGGYARWRYVEELGMNKYVKWFHNDMSMPLQATY